MTKFYNSKLINAARMFQPETIIICGEFYKFLRIEEEKLNGVRKEWVEFDAGTKNIIEIPIIYQNKGPRAIYSAI